jgi:chromosome segregation ATPase
LTETALTQALEEMQRLRAELAACVAQNEHLHAARMHDQVLIAKLSEENERLQFALTAAEDAAMKLASEVERLQTREKSYANSWTAAGAESPARDALPK